MKIMPALATTIAFFGLAACGSTAVTNPTPTIPNPTLAPTVAPTIAPTPTATATTRANPTPTAAATGTARSALTLSFICEASQYQGKRMVWAYVLFHGMTVGDYLVIGNNPQQYPIHANPFRFGVNPGAQGITLTPGPTWSWTEDTPNNFTDDAGTFIIPPKC